MEIVEVSNASVLPSPAPAPSVKLPDLPPPPTDLIGPGDVLGVSVYEAGVSLFGNAGPGSSGRAGSFDPTVKVQTLPDLRVDDAGTITIPYAGRLSVAGRTIGEIQAQISDALRGMSQDPQVLVVQQETINNAVIVGGEVARPGRLVLQTNRETIADVIALAGGYRGSAKDLLVKIERGGEDFEVRLGDLLSLSGPEVRAYPGDRLTVLSLPQSFSVLGASGRVDQVPFARSRVSLIEAVAVSGGVSPAYGDPAAIFVFRYNPNEQGTQAPVVYHFNMMRTGSYFLAQQFEMKDKDVVYFGNAAANQPSKVIQLVSQLFSPILTVTSAVQTLQNSN
jgi:polysaccharide export outer membrane protein